MSIFTFKSRRVAFSLLILISLFSLPLYGQTTSVTLNVTDTGGNNWAGAYTFQLVSPPGGPTAPPFYLNGTLMTSGQTTVSGTLASGTASVTLSNTSQITPSGAKWTLNVCYSSVGPCYGSPNTYSTSGSSFTISLTPPAPNTGTSSGGVSLADPLQTIVASPNCLTGQARCYQLPASGGILWDCSWSNTSSTITCPDAVFTAAMNGMNGFGTNPCPYGGGCENSSTAVMPYGTITYVSSTQVTMSTTSTAACTYAVNSQACVFLWGNDATTVINNAATAAFSTPDCVDLQLAGGVWFFSSGIANATTAACKLGIGISRTGPGFFGQGANSTILVPTPSFNFSSCTNGTSGVGCNFTSPGINLRNFQVFGGGNSVGGTHAVHFIELNTTNTTTNNLINVSFSSFGGASTSMVGLDVYNSTPQPWIGTWIQGFGTIELQLDGPGGSTGGEPNQLYIEDCALECINFNTASTFLVTNNSVIGPGSGTSSNTVYFTNGSASWTSNNDAINFGSTFNGTSNTAINMSGGGTVRLNGTGVVQPSTNTTQAIFMGNGAVLYVSNSTVTGSGSHTGINCNSSTAKVYDGGNNTITAGAPFFNCTLANLQRQNSVTGTNLATSNVGLTSGWSTSTVASASGDSHTGRFTITGAAGAASPTLTLTFPTTWFIAPASCQLSETGVNDLASLTSVSAGTPTTTTVLFTFVGTPVATTYQFDYVCGP